MIKTSQFTAGFLFLAAAVMTAPAGAAELKVLSVDAMKPAMEELAKSFNATSKEKLTVEFATPADVEKKINAEDEYDIVIADKKATQSFYTAAKIAGGSSKALAKKGDEEFEASMVNWCQQPLAGNEVIKFLTTPKAAEVYKAKGMQPG